jgi:hypothetical protein
MRSFYVFGAAVTDTAGGQFRVKIQCIPHETLALKT